VNYLPKERRIKNKWKKKKLKIILKQEKS
jgi:hypothetical protein